jgi:hypothetical protein
MNELKWPDTLLDPWWHCEQCTCEASTLSQARFNQPESLFTTCKEALVPSLLFFSRMKKHFF